MWPFPAYDKSLTTDQSVVLNLNTYTLSHNIRSFSVSYRSKNTDGSFSAWITKPEHVNRNKTTTTVSDLPADSVMEIRLQAHTHSSTSLFSSPVTVHTLMKGEGTSVDNIL